MVLNEVQAKARNFPVTSIGSLLDEPFTGLVYLKGSGITEDFRSLKGKRIGYVGEFGKVYLPHLVQQKQCKPKKKKKSNNPRSKSTNSPNTTT